MSCKRGGRGSLVILVMALASGYWQPPRPTLALESPEPMGPAFVRGDADMSGSVTLSDAIVVLRHLFVGGPQAPCLKAADADDNGYVNVTDAVLVLGFLFVDGPCPRPPYPRCGVDETSDRLGCGNVNCEARE